RLRRDLDADARATRPTSGHTLVGCDADGCGPDVGSHVARPRESTGDRSRLARPRLQPRGLHELRVDGATLPGAAVLLRRPLPRAAVRTGRTPRLLGHPLSRDELALHGPASAPQARAWQVHQVLRHRQLAAAVRVPPAGRQPVRARLAPAPDL